MTSSHLSASESADAVIFVSFSFALVNFEGSS